MKFGLNLFFHVYLIELLKTFRQHEKSSSMFSLKFLVCDKCLAYCLFFPIGCNDRKVAVRKSVSSMIPSID